MKKALAILLLVGVLVLSMAGSAFANPIWQGGYFNWNTAVKTQVVGQNAAIGNVAVAASGPATGVGALIGVGAAASPATAANYATNDIIQVVVQ